MAMYSIISISVIALLSIITNIVLAYKLSAHCGHHKPVKYKPAQNSRNPQTFVFKGQHYSSFTTSTDEEEETIFMQTNNGRNNAGSFKPLKSKS